VLPQSISLQTTAHTLSFTFALLALYPDEQERLYQHIKGVMSSLNRVPVGSKNLSLCGWLTFPVDLRGHEPLHSIISVSLANFSATMMFLNLV
jgi:cytochrome P450